MPQLRDSHVIERQRAYQTVRYVQIRASLKTSIPVLSLQTILTEPKVSTLGSLLTIAPCFDILKTPSASVTVTIIGRPSGIAATARETPICNMSSHFLLCNIPIIMMRAMTPPDIQLNSFPSRSMETCKGVLGLSISCRDAEMLPNSVFAPVPMTNPRPCPDRTKVPMKAMLVCSLRRMSAPTVPAAGEAYEGDVERPYGCDLIVPCGRSITPACFKAGSFSPVRFDSSIDKSAALVIRISAGMRSPVEKITRSPGTSCLAGTVVDALSSGELEPFGIVSISITACESRPCPCLLFSPLRIR